MEARSWRVLVTGAGGFFGRRIVGHLLERGHRVHAHYRTLESDAAVPVARLHVQAGNLCAGLDLPEGLDLVIHAAAAGQLGLGTADCLTDNLDTTRAVLAAVLSRRVPRLLFLSSMAAIGYGDGPVVDETSGVVNPHAYGMAKRLCECLFEDSAEHLQTLILRLPNVLGRGCREHFVSEVFKRLRRHQPVTAFNPDRPFNSIIHVDDLCRFVGSVIDQGWSKTELLCLGSAEPLTIAAVIDRLAQSCASCSPVTWASAPRPSYLISTRRAEAGYGYRPEPVAVALDRYTQEELTIPIYTNGLGR